MLLTNETAAICGARGNENLSGSHRPAQDFLVDSSGLGDETGRGLRHRRGVHTPGRAHDFRPAVGKSRTHSQAQDVRRPQGLRDVAATGATYARVPGRQEAGLIVRFTNGTAVARIQSGRETTESIAP
jgi:hypothetical protein